MLILFDDGSSFGTCSIHCTAVQMAVDRRKTVTRLYTADFETKALVDAEKAFWVIGGSRTGVMTIRSKWAFANREGAESFTKKYGGQIADFDAVMKATFEDMHNDIKAMHHKRTERSEVLQDTIDHPECKYCGMKRKQFAFSRTLIKYNDGLGVGTCSIHCAAIDLALHTDRIPEVILVGDYRTKRLIDAERAIWVIGGKKTGVMSIKGKWAFENRVDADDFIEENGGSVSTLDEIMKATFEDMYETLR